MFKRFKPKEGSILGMMSELTEDTKGCTEEKYREYKEKKMKKV